MALTSEMFAQNLIELVSRSNGVQIDSETNQMRKFLAGLLILGLTATQSFANVQCNQHGAVVTLDNGDTYYLGKNCDAAKKGGGEGRWWLAASGIGVGIEGEGAVLIGFDIDCDLPACWLD